MNTLPLYRCRRCNRPLKPGPYGARGLGPVCGGPIRVGRAAARLVVTVRAEVLEADEQMELWEETP